MTLGWRGWAGMKAHEWSTAAWGAYFLPPSPRVQRLPAGAGGTCVALHLLTCPLGAQESVPLASALCPRLCSGPLPLRAHHTSSLPPIFSLDLHTKALDEAAALCPASTRELSDSADFTRRVLAKQRENHLLSRNAHRVRQAPAARRPSQATRPGGHPSPHFTDKEAEV